MKAQKGFASLIAIVAILGAVAIGIIFQQTSKAIDHPVEQVAESVLAHHGIEVDFSKSKKEKQNVR